VTLSTARPAESTGNENAVVEFASEEELNAAASPLNHVTSGVISIVHVHHHAADDFPSETELPAHRPFVFAEPAAAAAAATRRSLTMRKCRMSTFQPAVQGGSAIAAVMAILALYAGSGSLVIGPVNDPTATRSRLLGSSSAGGRSSVPAVSVSSKPDEPIGRSTARQSHRASPAPGSSSTPLREVPSRATDATPRSRVAAHDPPQVRTRAPLSSASVPRGRDFRDTEDAQGNVNGSHELSHALLATDIAAIGAISATPAPLVRSQDFRAGLSASDDPEVRPPVVATAAASELTPTSPDNSAAVRDLLSGYQAAYGTLDAALAKQIWPSVDQRALARAFNSLESQSVTFETCDLTVNDAQAIASCRGNATYVTRIGNRSHTETRQWTFLLEKSAERWVIGAVQIR
jgi:hypothetical protein